MNEIEKITELQKCADRHRLLHEKRMAVEYRAFFTALTFYVVSTWSLLKFDINQKGHPVVISILVGYLILALTTSRFLKTIHESNEKNKTLSRNYESIIVGLLSLGICPIPKDLKRDNFDTIDQVELRSSIWGWQSTIILLLAMICGTIIWFA